MSKYVSRVRLSWHSIKTNSENKKNQFLHGLRNVSVSVVCVTIVLTYILIKYIIFNEEDRHAAEHDYLRAYIKNIQNI